MSTNPARQMIEAAFPEPDLPPTFGQVSSRERPLLDLCARLGRLPTPGEIRRERQRTAHGAGADEGRAHAAFLAHEARLQAELAAETRTWERQAAEARTAQAARQRLLRAIREAEAREARERVVVAWVVVGWGR